MADLPEAVMNAEGVIKPFVATVSTMRSAEDKHALRKLVLQRQALPKRPFTTLMFTVALQQVMFRPPFM